MITSEKAVEKLKDELVNRFSHIGLGFRVYHEPDVSGDLKLALKLDMKNPNDETIETHGIQLFLDPVDSSQLKDLELDYVDGPTGGFVIKDIKKIQELKRTP